MSDKKLIIVIVAEQGYIRNQKTDEGFSAQNDILFGAITDTYIPLLNLFTKLSAENIPFKLGLVLSPVLCTLLSDEVVQEQYINYLDRRIALGDVELERNKNDPTILDQVRSCLARLQKTRVDFTDRYQKNLVAAFKEFAQKEYVELIATAATYAYLPHYADLKEALNAQVDTGIRAQKNFFEESGDGFYLPYLGWANELESVIRSYNMNYTIVDTKALLFSKDCPSTGIFSPVRTNRSLVIFAKDNETPQDITDKDKGFAHNGAYRNQNEDIGFSLEGAELENFLGNSRIRIQTGYKYTANDSKIYDAKKAHEQVKKDALAFYSSKKEKLNKASSLMEEGQDAILTCTIPAELLGQTWFEGIDWLEEVIRLVFSESKQEEKISLSLCRSNLEKQFSLPKITLYPCGESGTGYGEDLLDSSNSYMYRYVRTATERVIDLTERFPGETGLKARLLDTGAKEVLLAQSGAWPSMLHEQKLPNFAAESFKKYILSFTTVFDSLASNTVSTEWLTNIEREHSIFPWITYRVFSRKK